MSSTRRPFVHLHNHTEYSLLDGALRVRKLVAVAAQRSMPALAITDHGNLFGAIEFYRAAQAAGVKPIIGMEAYVAPFDRRERKIHQQIAESSFHLTLLARDLDGYHNLMQLASAGYLEGFYYRPRIDKELLARHSKGLLALSGCLKGEVTYFLMHNDPERARAAAHAYREILGAENFYLELQDSGLPESKKARSLVARLGEELDIPLVATNDCHYLEKEDARAHDVLLCIQTGKKLSDRARLRFETSELYFKTAEVMAELFADVPVALDNAVVVADRCNLLLEPTGKRFFLPVVPRPAAYSSDFDYLAALARAGLQERYRTVDAETTARLDHELGVIKRMGFAGYFLIAQDIVTFARARGISVGPGRGSAVGSLALYALGITDVDPLRYGLIFERFLNPDRVSLPDVDIDFTDLRRDEVINYIRERYGAQNVAQIITFGTMQARAVVRDVGRVLDIPFAEVDRLAKLLGGNSLEQALATPELKAQVAAKPEYQELFSIARKLEGLARHASIHASGVVIAPRPLPEFVPLYKSADGDICTQYDMDSISAVGLLKMDILGLRTLSVVDAAFALCAAAGTPLDRATIPLDDPATYRLLQNADTVGIFQLESFGMRDILRKFKPATLADLIAVISLYRPGPLGSIDTNDLARRRHGQAKPSYPHPLLEGVLRETYGIILYQEQVMQIASIIAGFSMAEADHLRRAMAKKEPELMAEMRERFLAGAARSKIARPVAERIFDTIAPFAGYGFNKSHSAGYAHLSYLTAYLKANYPRAFMCALLSSELGDSDKLAKFLSETRRMGIEVRPPDINRSDYRFTLDGAAIRFGLGAVKNLGQGASEAIVAARRSEPFTGLAEFVRRVRQAVNRKACESLVKAGAFDALEPNRLLLLEQLPGAFERSGSGRMEFLDRQTSFFGPVEAPAAPRPFLRTDLLPLEKEAFGFYFSGHPLEKYADIIKALALVETSRLPDLQDGQVVALGGVVTSRKVKRDRRDQEFAIVTLEDFDGEVEVFVFSDVYERSRTMVKPESALVVKGRVKLREGEKPKLTAEHVLPLSEARRMLDAVIVDLKPTRLDESTLAGVKEKLIAHPGHCPVFFTLRPDNGGEEERRRVIKLKEIRVEPSAELLTELRDLLGPQAVRLHGSV